MRLRLRPSAALTVVISAFFLAISAFVPLAARDASAQSADEPTPTPTPSPADAGLAARFAAEGNYDAAIAGYLAALGAAPSAGERLALRQAIASAYLDDDQPGGAIEQLDAYLLEAPPGTDVSDAQFLLAEALLTAGRPADALPLYEAYIQQGGPAGPYARMGRSIALAELGRGTEASVEAEAALQTDVPQAARATFAQRLATVLDATSPADAIRWYEALGNLSESPADEALGIWRAAAIRENAGEGSALEAALTVVQQYPDTPIALEVVRDYPAVTILVDTYALANIYYRNGETETARDLFQELAGSTSPSAAAAAFYRGVIAEEAGEGTSAIAWYGRVAAIDAQSDLADNALWWRGRLQEYEGRAAAARLSYERIISDYNETEWAPEARFRRALLDYDEEHYEEAAQAFSEIAGGSGDEERQRALLWQAKALEASGDEQSARVVWQSLLDDAATYYGLRAAVLLGQDAGELGDGDMEPRPPDWTTIEAWLTDASVDVSAGLSALLFESRWTRAEELRTLGLGREAAAEYEVILANAGADPAKLYQLTRAFHNAGNVSLAARAATLLLDATPDDVLALAPPDIWRLAYPFPYEETLERAADGRDVPELLMPAVMRQESFFDPLAGSPAGALGLMQIIPDTGDAIATELDAAEFEVDDLFRPALNLEFGAHYMDEQLGTFDGNVYHALAAYNGGPAAAERWVSASDGDVDRFVAEIEFGQTEAYVQLVAENLARYLWLYGESPVPALPRD
jgi:soluble lytic murein transglycosylase